MKKLTVLNKSILTALCIALCVVLPMTLHAIPRAVSCSPPCICPCFCAVWSVEHLSVWSAAFSDLWYPVCLPVCPFSDICLS